MVKIEILEENCNFKLFVDYDDKMTKNEVLDDVIEWQNLYREKLFSQPKTPELATDRQIRSLRITNESNQPLLMRALEHAGITKIPLATKDQADKAIRYIKEIEKEENNG